ncbi:hypothetical protein Fmac_011577 [Flemingia macrophylla]|uniref:DNA topoisomerase I catalytic core eukaryotic-type domain-containing protein n=1 Tax=Flemingia macrophylla TaxID=520843 RepID=A0ABD1MMT8_9FABA
MALSAGALGILAPSTSGERSWTEGGELGASFGTQPWWWAPGAILPDLCDFSDVVKMKALIVLSSELEEFVTQGLPNLSSLYYLKIFHEGGCSRWLHSTPMRVGVSSSVSGDATQVDIKVSYSSSSLLLHWGVVRNQPGRRLFQALYCKIASFLEIVMHPLNALEYLVLSVVIICNHQRSVSKSHGAQMSKLNEKIDELQV